MYQKERYAKIDEYQEYILVGDVGGTNTNLAIFGDKNLLLLYRFKSQNLNSLHDAVNETLKNAHEEYKISISKACFAIAGTTTQKEGKLTNVKWGVSVSEMFQKTLLGSIVLINDFEAIGYAINVIKENQIIKLNTAKEKNKAIKALIGAGTGLGTSTLYHDGKKYTPLSSEGGHGDFAAHTDDEFALKKYIKKINKIKNPVSWEQVLSGKGLLNIYHYIKSLKKYKPTKYTKEVDKEKNPTLISKYRIKDNTCKATFTSFAKIYARAAKNLALETLAYGGLYIAGGIAEKNLDVFQKPFFLKEFLTNYKQTKVLQQIPIYVITDYNISLYGSAYAAQLPELVVSR